MGSQLSSYYGSDVPDFTDEIVHFKFPSSYGVHEERNNFYNELCGSVNDTRDNFEKKVRLIERRLFSCLHALSHISFDYKKLIEMLQEESLKNGEEIQDCSNKNVSGCDEGERDVEFEYKVFEEKQKVFEEEKQKENGVHYTEMETMRWNRELLDEENDIRMSSSGPRIAKVERIVQENPIVLFVLSYAHKENDGILTILKTMKTEFKTIYVDENVRIRLGVQEYTGKEEFPLLFIGGQLKDISEFEQ